MAKFKTLTALYFRDTELNVWMVQHGDGTWRTLYGAEEEAAERVVLTIAKCIAV